MRHSVILSNFYEQLLLHEAKKSGLIKEMPILSEKLYNPDEMQEVSLFFNSLLDKRTEERKKLLQVILLFDEIILPSAPGSYDYNRLKDIGTFKIIPFDDFYYDSSRKKEGQDLHVQQLKQAILPVAEKRLKSYYEKMPNSLDYSDFVSALYDSVLSFKALPRKYRYINKINKRLFDERNTEYYNIAEAMQMPDSLLKAGRFFTDVAGIICSMYDELSWQLQISSENEATIMNCEYQLANIGCESFTSEVDSAMNAYKILSVECRNAMGTLPEVDSIQEVIQIKEKRKHDLHNLREVLSQLEYEIKNSGSISAIKKAAKDISKASKALSVGNRVSQVTRWTNRFLLPLSVASIFMQNKEVVIASGIIGVIGRTATIVGDSISQRNNWIELII